MSAGWGGRVVTRARARIRAKGQHQPCWRCGKTLDLDREPWTVGHLIDRVAGGSNDPSNLAPECPGCNYSAGGKLGGRIRAAQRRPRPRDPRMPRW
jgi:5-methylcytosine-specific restriction endonuclease McrA